MKIAGFFMKIYRIQHKIEKKGPYTMKGNMRSKRLNNRLNVINADLFCPIRHPQPHMLSFGINTKFGFSNIHNLIEWFGGDVVKALLKIGFEIVEIKCDDCIVERKQVQYDQTKVYNEKKLNLT